MNTKPDIYADNPVVTRDYQILVMQNYITGFIDCRVRGSSGPWQRCPTLPCPNGTNWNWSGYDYRIAPDSRPKKTVPMERDDYPPFFWLREKANPDSMHLCTGIVGGWLKTVENLPSFDKNWLSIYAAAALNVADPRPCEYSTDRKTWKPCTKEVVA